MKDDDNKFLGFLRVIRRDFVLLALLSIVIADQVNIYSLKKAQVIYIGIFDSVAVLPNDFALDAKALNELSLKGRKGNIIIGGKVSNELLQYMQAHVQQAERRCGINITKATAPNGVNSTLLHNDNNYMYAVDVAEDILRRSVESICAIRERR